MTRATWLEEIRRLLRPAPRRGQHPRRYRPWLDVLEERLPPAITLSIANPEPFPEGDAGTSDMLFEVTRSGELGPEVTVNYTTRDGTARAGIDYQASSGTLPFAPDETTATIAVPIIGNTLLQPDRTFTVEFSNPLVMASFAPFERFFPAGRSVAVADFNGDGRPEFALGNPGPLPVHVFLNATAPGDASPSFVLQPTQFFGSSPSSVATGDFNLDGRPDLAVTNSDSTTVTVRLNATPPGADTLDFDLPRSFTVGPSQPNSLTVGDFNGDGKPDLAVTQTAGFVSVLLNATAPGASSPSFNPQVVFGTGANSVAVAVRDLNGDGKPDLAVACYSSSVSVLLNTTPAGAASASFAPHQLFDAGPNPLSVAIGDLNGDGRPDLAIANGIRTPGVPGTVAVLLNTTAPGATTFSFAARQSFPTGFRSTAVAIGDVNGDGRPDLAVTNYSSDTVSVLLNTTAPGALTASFAPQQAFTTSRRPWSVALDDFNGDGKPDLAVASYDGLGSVSVLLNTLPPIAVDASFVPQRTFGTGNRPSSVAVADFNGDGKPDLAVVNNDPSTVSVLLNTTAAGATLANFAPRREFANGAGSVPYFVTVGDFNGDGKPDLVLANPGDHTLSVLLNVTPPGATTPSFALAQTFAGGSSAYSVAIGDFNGDGKPDLAVANSITLGSVSVLLNTTPPGAGTASFAPRQTFAVGSYPTSVVVANVNGDGRPDLIVVNRNSNTVSVLLNTTPTGATTPNFAPQQTFPTGSFPLSVAVGDVNGDGTADLAVANYSSNTVSVLLNTTPAGATTPSFGPHQTFPTGTNPFSVAVADINGDGKPDPAVANFNADTLSVLLNTTPTGATTLSFSLRQDFATGTGPRSVALADFNGDGRPDLAVANFSHDTVSVLLNNASAITLSGSPATGTIQDDDAPVTIVIAAGNNQAATVNTPFATNLAVDVRNAANSLVEGVRVTFSGPADGPSGTFPGGAAVTVVTNASGRATAPTFTANTVAGSYAVTAEATGGDNLSTSFDLTNVPAAADHFFFDAPANCTAGAAFSVTVTILDRFGNTVVGYRGTVRFTSSDPAAQLPAPYTFTEEDNGVHTFENAFTLFTLGEQTLTATDTVAPGITGSALITVDPA